MAIREVAESFAAMALLSDPALDVRRYLEDLVTIAVSSARQAEDLAVQAREASWKAQGGMAVVASIGALGLVVGIAGFAASRSANIRLAEVRGEVAALHEMQRESQDQLAEIASRTSDQRDAVEVTQQPGISRPWWCRSPCLHRRRQRDRRPSDIPSPGRIRVHRRGASPCRAASRCRPPSRWWFLGSSRIFSAICGEFSTDRRQSRRSMGFAALYHPTRYRNLCRSAQCQ